MHCANDDQVHFTLSPFCWHFRYSSNAVAVTGIRSKSHSNSCWLLRYLSRTVTKWRNWAYNVFRDSGTFSQFSKRLLWYMWHVFPVYWSHPIKDNHTTSLCIWKINKFTGLRFYLGIWLVADHFCNLMLTWHWNTCVTVGICFEWVTLLVAE